MTGSNLALVFTVFIIYMFLGYGISELYGTPNTVQSQTVFGQSTNFSMVTLIFDVGGTMTYQDNRIPSEVNLLIITPLNFLMLGAALYFARGGGT